MIKTSIFIVGTRNANGEEDTRAYTKDAACRQFRDLLEGGFSPPEIVCLEGFEGSLRIEAATVVTNGGIV